MSDEVPENSERKKSKMNPVEEGSGSVPSSKKRCTKALTSMKKATKKEESHPKALVKKTRKGDSKVKAMPSSTVVSSVKPAELEVIVVGTDPEVNEEIHILEEGDSKVKAMPSATVVSSVKPADPEVIVTDTDRKEIDILGEDDFIVEEVPSTSVVPCLKLIGSKVFSADTNRELSKEIENLGEGYERVFQLLDEMQGTLEFKKELVEYAIKEVKRLKTQDLIKHLEKRLKKINKRLNKKKSQI